MRVSGGDRRRGQSRPYSDSIHLPRQEYPGPRSYDAMLRGGQHATHQPLSLPDAGKGSSLNLWMWRYGRGQERKVSILDAMEARAKTVREARARAGETDKRRRLAARDGAPTDAAP